MSVADIAPVDFTVVIPARMASTRLPDKPLANIAGCPMVVRTAQAAARSAAARVVVATDDTRVASACAAHGVEAIMTAAHHASGSDRLAEASLLLALRDDAIVVNVQGDEPLIEPALINAVAHTLAQNADCAMSTAAHPIDCVEDFVNPNVVKVICDAASRALYFSRAPMPWPRDDSAAVLAALSALQTPKNAPKALNPEHSKAVLEPRLNPAPMVAGVDALRHVGIYAYRAVFLRTFPQLPPAPLERIEMLEQLRALWHGHAIAVYRAAHASALGVDTPEDLERVRKIFENQG